MQLDCRGLPITTSSADAASSIDQAVKAYMDYGTTAGLMTVPTSSAAT